MASDQSGDAGEDKFAARRARKERRRELSREEILAGARRVLLRNGVAAMTLDAVAKEVGMSKTGLYYYYKSKDALVFELVYGAVAGQAQTVAEAARNADDGGEALGAIVRGTVDTFAGHLDDFRLTFFFTQVAGSGTLHWDADQFARIRPLNDLMFSRATELLGRQSSTRSGVEPRLLAFLAYLSAIGLLTMKGMVEHMDDPLLYSDSQLVEAFARVFGVAAAP